MKQTVHNKHDRLDALHARLASCLGACAREAQVSDVKRDGTVIIRFRSCDEMSAVEATEAFGRHLTSEGIDFTQTDDNRIRMFLP